MANKMYYLKVEELRPAQPGELFGICPGIPIPKPATPQPPEWKGDVVAHMVFPDGWVAPSDRALDDFIARRKAKREMNAAPTREEIIAEKQSRWAAEDQERLFSRAMSTPLPHDPPMSVRLMPWRGKE